MNTQLSPGTANIVTGVPERVGAPIEAFKEVGAVLTQRYWQNKQAHDSITTSLKNMPTLVDSVDKPKLAAKSKYVDEEFKRIIDTDNFHNATATVMNVSKTLTTDEDIKGINAAVNEYSSKTKKLEEGFEKNPMWRTYASSFKSRFLEQYEKQGGATDANGKPQPLSMALPTTDMDTSSEIKRVEEAARDMKAFVTTNFGNQTYVEPALLNEIEDPLIRQSLAKLSEDKVKVTDLSVDRLRSAAMEVLEADPDFKIKKAEIIRAEHRLNTGSDVVKAEQVSQFLKSKGSAFEREMSILVSPTFKKAVEDLQAKYLPIIQGTNSKEAYKANSEYNKKIADLKKNEDLYKEGQNALLNTMKEPELRQFYFGLQDSDITKNIVQNVDRFRQHEVDLNRHYFDNKAIDLVLAKRKEEAEGRATTNNNESDISEINLDYLNPDSDENKSFERLEATYLANKGADPKLKLAYESALAVRESKNRGLLYAFQGMDESIKRKTLTSSWGIFDDLSQAAFTKDKDKRYSKEFAKDLISGNKASTISMSANTLAGYVLQQIKPQELLSTSSNKLLIKYLNPLLKESGKGIGKDLEKAIYASINGIKGKFAKSIEENAGSSKIVPMTTITTIGTPTQSSQLERINVLESIFKGATTDLKAGTILDISKLDLAEGEYVGYEKINNKELNSDDLNNMAEASVQKLHTNGIYRGQGYTYLAKLPVYKKDDNGKAVFQRYIDKEVVYNGNSAIAEESTVAEANRLKSYIKPTEHTYYDAKQTAHNLMGNLGSHTLDVNGVNIQDRMSELERYGDRSFTKDIVLTKDDDFRNGSFIRVTGNNGVYTVEHKIRQNGRDITAIPYSTTNLKDIIEVTGVIKASNSGLDREIEDIVISDILRNGK